MCAGTVMTMILNDDNDDVDDCDMKEDIELGRILTPEIQKYNQNKNLEQEKTS